MSFRRSIHGLISCSFLGLLAAGCSTPPPPGSEEEESIEAMTERTEMMTHRARLEPKTGIAVPINDRFEIATPTDGMSGIKGAIEVVQKGMWLGLEFDFAEIDTKNPAQNVQDLITQGSTLKTENLMKSFDRYEFLFTWDYDIPLGSYLPSPENSGWDFYSPILRPGLGLGAVAINPKEADAVAPLGEFDNLIAFLARPNLSLLFPFHQHLGLFVEADFDWIPESQFSGKASIQGVGRVSADIGDKVELSTANFWVGLTIEF